MCTRGLSTGRLNSSGAKALRENVTPLLQAGEGQTVARSATAMRRCVWIDSRAKRKK
jgi:hypothetical protein